MVMNYEPASLLTGGNWISRPIFRPFHPFGGINVEVYLSTQRQYY